MAIGQSNMFSAPGDTQLGGNQQLAGASQPTAPSMGIFDTTAPVGQTMNQMQQSQLSPTISNPITGQTIDQMGQPQPQAQAQPQPHQPLRLVTRRIHQRQGRISPRAKGGRA